MCVCSRELQKRNQTQKRLETQRARQKKGEYTMRSKEIRKCERVPDNQHAEIPGNE